MPSASRKANSTIMLSEKPKNGSITNARNILSGTLRPTNRALVVPMKNSRIRVTSKKPMMMVLIKSFSVTRVSLEVSPVMVMVSSLGKPALLSATICLILSEARIRFSPCRFTTLSVMAGLPSRRA